MKNTFIKLVSAAVALILTVLSVSFIPFAASAQETEITYTLSAKSGKICAFQGNVRFNEEVLSYKESYLMGETSSLIREHDGAVYFVTTVSKDSLDFSDYTEWVKIVFTVKGSVSRSDIEPRFVEYYDLASFKKRSNVPFYYTETINGKKVGGGYVDLDDTGKSYKEPDQGIFARETQPPTQNQTQASTQSPATTPVQESTQVLITDPVQNPTQNPSAAPVEDSTRNPVTDPVQDQTQTPSAYPYQDPTQSNYTVPEQISTQIPYSEPAETFPYSTEQDPSGNPATAPAGSYETGDVNRDGAVNIIDVTIIQKYIAKLISFDDEQMKLADFVDDGIIKITDATAIQYKINGMKWVKKTDSD